MHDLQIYREELLNPLLQCLSVAEKKSITPILTYVLLKFTANRLEITAADNEIQVTIVVNLQIANDDVVLTLPCYKLLEICKGLSTGTLLTISLDNEKAIVRAGNSRFTLLSLPASDYPLFSTIATAIEISIRQQDLHYVLTKTVFAMAEQDMRYYLNGMLFNIVDNMLEVIATDTHRLALATRPLVTAVTGTYSMLVPKKCITEILRVINIYQDDWQLKVNDKQVIFSCKEFTLISKLINEKKIDFKKLIPKAGEKKLLLSCQELKQTLNLAAVLTNEKSRGVRLQLKHNKLLVTASNPEYESAETELPIEFPYDDFSIAFNVAYLLDIIAVTLQPRLCFSFSDAGMVVLVQPENVTDCIFVVMPLRI